MQHGLAANIGVGGDPCKSHAHDDGDDRANDGHEQRVADDPPRSGFGEHLRVVVQRREGFRGEAQDHQANDGHEEHPHESHKNDREKELASSDTERARSEARAVPRSRWGPLFQGPHRGSLGLSTRLTGSSFPVEFDEATDVGLLSFEQLSEVVGLDQRQLTDGR